MGTPKTRCRVSKTTGYGGGDNRAVQADGVCPTEFVQCCFLLMGLALWKLRGCPKTSISADPWRLGKARDRRNPSEQLPRSARLLSRLRGEETAPRPERALFVSQRFGRIQMRGAVGGEDAEDQSHQAGDAERHYNRHGRNRNADVREQGHR